MSKSPSVQDSHELAHAQLFMIRMWRETLSEGCVEWRGKVQHVASGEVRYFRDWTVLIATMQEMLEADEVSGEPPTRAA